MGKRDRLEIIYTILDIVRKHKNAIKPTPLLRFTNVSSQSFQQYYSELLEKKFLIENIDRKGRKSISCTEKGFRYLEKYSLILGFIDEFEL
ncbi:TPA: hypothetical protein HA278_07890 [Candidatus Woesearchaeota archaeon]|nr:hypothetical protein [Candidatus Woesearchaeota archaeon]|tara:strand:+ start:169 stop:441 length:273 start_codon:yes stop_codon:yes gene_type:complete